MTISIPVLQANATTTFQQWFDRTNYLSNVVTQYTMTANTQANGSLTTGNAFLSGVFGATVIGVGELRGGNVQSTAVLPISSNVYVGNSTSNVQISYIAAGGLINVGVVGVNSTVVSVGSNVKVSATDIRVGNATANVVVNSTAITVNAVSVALTNSSVVVANNGSTIGTRGKINFVAGSNIALTVSDHAAGEQVNVVIASTATVPDLTGDVTTSAGVSTISANVVTHAMLKETVRQTIIPFIIDGGGTTITTGSKGFIPVPFKCTITEWTLLGDTTGSIVVDIWKDTYTNYPPTGADSITASAKPTISSSTKGRSSTLTGWTTTLNVDDLIGFNVDSVTSMQRVTVYLKVTRTD